MRGPGWTVALLLSDATLHYPAPTMDEETAPVTVRKSPRLLNRRRGALQIQGRGIAHSPATSRSQPTTRRPLHSPPRSILRARRSSTGHSRPILVISTHNGAHLDMATPGGTSAASASPRVSFGPIYFWRSGHPRYAPDGATPHPRLTARGPPPSSLAVSFSPTQATAQVSQATSPPFCTSLCRI